MSTAPQPHAFRHLLGKSTQWVLAHPWQTALLNLLLLAAALVAAAGYLRIDTDTSAMLSAKLDWRQQQIALEQAFPDFRNGSVVLVNAATRQRASDAASLLQERLQMLPLVTRAFTAEADPTLRQQGLILMPEASFARTADALVSAQPILGRLQQAPHLAGFAEVLRQAADNDAEQLDVVFAALTRSLDQHPASAVDWRAVLGTDQQHAHALVLLDHPPASGRAVLQAVRDAIAAAHDVADIAFDARLTGALPLRVEELTAAANGAALAAVLTLIAVVKLLWLGLRSLRLVLACLLTVLCGLGLTAGFAALAVGHLNLISVAFTALFIGLAVDYVVHLCMQVRARLQAGDAREAAIVSAVQTVGVSLCLCTLTTACAFFAFLLTSYRGIAELGLIAGVGVGLGLLVSLTLLPALLQLLLPATRPGDAGATASTTFLTAGSLNIIRWLALAAAAVAVWLAMDLRFAYNPIDLKPPQAESVQAHAQLLQSGDAPLRAEILATDAQQADRLRNSLQALPAVARVESAQRLLSPDAETRLQQLDDLALTLGGVLSQPLELQPPPPDTRQVLSGLAADAAPTHAAFAAAMQRWLDANPDAADIRHLQHAWLADLPGLLALLGDGLNGQALSLQQWPAHLRGQWVAGSGQHRLVVVPTAALDTPEALAEFVDAVLAVAPAAVGAPVIYRKAGLAVQRAFIEAFAAALICISILLMLVLRSVADVLRVLVPLLLGSALLLACAAQIPIPLNFANIIALPLLLGIAVDNGIHVLLRMRQPAAPPLLQTATGKAVVLSALTTLASFAALGFSAHRGMASMGQLLALGLVICVLCTLVVLPALRGQRQ